MRVRQLRGHRAHRAAGGRSGVVEEPEDSGFREASSGVAVEAGLVSRARCLLRPQQRPAETGCKQATSKCP